MKKLIFTVSMVVLACSCQCQSRNEPNQNQRYNEENRQNPPRRSGCGSCESEKPQAPQQNQTAATPEVKVEKAQ